MEQKFGNCKIENSHVIHGGKKTTYAMHRMKIIVSIFLMAAVTFIGCQEKENPDPDINTSNESQLRTSAPHFDVVIANLVDGEIVFVDNISSKVDEWTEFINDNSDLELNLANEYITQEENGDYFLIAKDEVLPATSAIKLVLDNNIFYEYKYLETEAVSSATVTCSGCTSTGPLSAGQCEPRNTTSNGWYCTDCSSGTCTKTSTAKIGSGIISAL